MHKSKWNTGLPVYEGQLRCETTQPEPNQNKTCSFGLKHTNCSKESYHAANRPGSTVEMMSVSLLYGWVLVEKPRPGLTLFYRTWMRFSLIVQREKDGERWPSVLKRVSVYSGLVVLPGPSATLGDSSPGFSPQGPDLPRPLAQRKTNNKTNDWLWHLFCTNHRLHYQFLHVLKRLCT